MGSSESGLVGCPWECLAGPVACALHLKPKKLGASLATCAYCAGYRWYMESPSSHLHGTVLLDALTRSLSLCASFKIATHYYYSLQSNHSVNGSGSQERPVSPLTVLAVRRSSPTTMQAHLWSELVAHICELLAQRAQWTLSAVTIQAPVTRPRSEIIYEKNVVLVNGKVFNSYRFL